MSALVQTHNFLPPSSLSQFLPPIPEGSRIELYTSSTIPTDVFSRCFNLVSSNMKAMYQRSSMGWHAGGKKR